MWLILLDHSSSMGSAFQASSDQATFRGPAYAGDRKAGRSCGERAY
jgi:hypothetical protein